MEIPRLALGTACFKSDDEIIKSVTNCVENCGYRHIDTSKDYESETAIGTALHDLFQRGVVKREEIWITTKLEEDCHNPEIVESELRGSLKRLQLDYIDLYLIHWPCETETVDGKCQIIESKYSIIETWKAMEKLVDIGLAKHIGVSNFNIGLMEKLRVCEDIKIQPFVNQVEMHLLYQQEAMTEYLNKRGIYIMAYSSLGAGTHEGKPSVLKNETLIKVANELGKPVAPVCIKFLQKLGDVVVIAKSTSPERNRENSELDFDISDEQMAELKKCDIGLRFISIPGFPFSDRW
ncbi:1,5-anhydro-D-fructose reductase [Tritrichomonas foetus]|uniref:1,5-anhydro-D-fructose reductase n=1 Tax=Tritrichomonas foetus TaxID=1144522 RepID=A0A1J4JM64_9EUKA|nr:1,5-anhydro-D-fructose reductase [Tritrichomonas foetus]|eukprot:OHS98356.1 1,5-anhydro-D-fructose reductase [Tritrichomonas foetus]